MNHGEATAAFVKIVPLQLLNFPNKQAGVPHQDAGEFLFTLCGGDQRIVCVMRAHF